MILLFDDHVPRVEPVKRWVGGRFGWAYHRFPIKGGISPAEVIKIEAKKWASDVAAMCVRPNYFARLAGAGRSPLTRARTA